MFEATAPNAGYLNSRPRGQFAVHAAATFFVSEVSVSDMLLSLQQIITDCHYCKRRQFGRVSSDCVAQDNKATKLVLNSLTCHDGLVKSVRHAKYYELAMKMHTTWLDKQTHVAYMY